jgi:dephospho-CoA kinase
VLKKRISVSPFGLKFTKIGLTGGIGSGKSTVLNLLRQEGVPVLQTDHLAHQLLCRDFFIKKITSTFGKQVLDRVGRIDRSKLAAQVFQNRRKQERLNRILHPSVRREVSLWINKQKRRSSPPQMVVVEVPLLFERGYYRFFDGFLSVSATSSIRRKRLVKRGWAIKDIQKRERLQWPQNRKNQMAHWVISNVGSKNDLKYAVNVWLKMFLSEPMPNSG